MVFYFSPFCVVDGPQYSGNCKTNKKKITSFMCGSGLSSDMGMSLFFVLLQKCHNSLNNISLLSVMDRILWGVDGFYWLKHGVFNIGYHRILFETEFYITQLNPNWFRFGSNCSITQTSSADPSVRLDRRYQLIPDMAYCCQFATVKLFLGSIGIRHGNVVLDRVGSES